MACYRRSLRTIFDEAAEIEPGEKRRAYLDEACGGDADLRANVEELLRAEETAGGFLGDLRREAHTANTPAAEGEGARIGRYKLLQKIGEGGYGVVYMADQTEPVKRRVAFKIIKLGMDTRSVVARFEAERQALALMDHPCIARVLDVGATDTGRPYFVMELVRGIKITDYCEQNHLSATTRLQLFIQVCQAVQHAHQKGIIHRDLKPSNILVTSNDGVPLPKVIDFGIAKATANIQLTDKTLFTRFEMFIGTPAYMSPEQAEFNASDVDTRTDIYALGVLLYELLTGQTPFDSEATVKSGLDALRKAIREKEPLKPSTALTQKLMAVDLRRREPTGGKAVPTQEEASADARLRQRLQEQIALLRGDLDWIILKAMEKDRTRRYDTANGLAMDLQRYLANEPVIARPPSRIYVLRKAFRRHRLAFGAGMVVAAALFLGGSASVWQAARVTDSERLARRTAYSSDMNLAQQALAANNLGRAQSLLLRQQPRPGQTDLRNWEWRYLWSQTRPDEHETFWEGTNLLKAISCSPDGALVALEMEQQAVVIDLASRTNVLRRMGYRLPTFAQHGSVLALTRTGSPDSEAVVLCDMIGQREIRSLPQNGYVLKVAFTPDDQRLLIITEHRASALDPEGDRRVSAWDLTTGRVLWQHSILPLERVTRTVLAISPDGSLFAVAIPEGKFLVGETETGKERLTAKATMELVTALAFAPDGTNIVSGAGYTDSLIRIWDVPSGTDRGTLEGHRSWVSSLLFTRDGRQLISTGGDETVRRWDWSKRAAAGVLRGHHREVDEIALLPNGRTLASEAQEGEVLLWDLDKPSDHPSGRFLRAGLASAVFSPDSRTIVGAQLGGGLASWDVQAMSELRRWRENSPNNSSSVRLACDAGSAALFERNGNISIWNLHTDIHTPLQAPSGQTVADCLFTHNGNYLVTVLQGTDGFTAWIWDVGHARPAGNFWFKTASRHEGRFAAPSLANTFLVADTDGLRLWDVGKPEKPPLYLPDRGEFDDFEITPDHKLGAGAFGEGYVRLWNMTTLQPVATLHDFMLGAHSVAFAPDGKRLVAGSNGLEALKLWDVGTRQEVLTLSAEGQLFEHTAFSPDGRNLFGINAAGTLYLWSAPSWEEIAAAEAKEQRQERTR
jgi:serine/threonine protein kinase/WD40 repeat protein